MNGIERLRAIAGAWDEWGLGGTLVEIADQIERELQEERDRWYSELCEAQMDKSRVTVVYLEMNKHCLGHEGMEDSPVARWARELREAIGGVLTDEDREALEWVRKRSGLDREALEWVRKRGGLDNVRAEWRSRVPRDLYVRRRQSLLRHIAECEAALGRRREIISELTHRVSDLVNENAELRMRAMPEDYEWYESDERFERPAVLAADGEPERKLPKLADMFGILKDREVGGDSWERIEEDATLSPEVYCHRNGIDISQKDGTEIFLADTVEPMARDIVRRCRALAERERGE